MNLPTEKEKRELEAKFICPEGMCLDDVLAAVAAIGLHSTKENPCPQTDAYLDTPEYTLLKANSALRIRKRGDNYVGTYKASKKQMGTVFERSEFTWTLSADEIKLWTEEKKPAIPDDVLKSLPIQGQTLRLVLRVEVLRHTAIITGNGGFQAEVSLDEVTYRGHKGQKHYREIEVELLAGNFNQLKQATDGLQTHLKLQPALDSKYRQGMILVGKYGDHTASQRKPGD